MKLGTGGKGSLRTRKNTCVDRLNLLAWVLATVLGCVVYVSAIQIKKNKMVNLGIIFCCFLLWVSGSSLSIVTLIDQLGDTSLHTCWKMVHI